MITKATSIAHQKKESKGAKLRKENKSPDRSNNQLERHCFYITVQWRERQSSLYLTVIDDIGNNHVLACVVPRLIHPSPHLAPELIPVIRGNKLRRIDSLIPVVTSWSHHIL